MLPKQLIGLQLLARTDIKGSCWITRSRKVDVYICIQEVTLDQTNLLFRAGSRYVAIERISDDPWTHGESFKIPARDIFELISPQKFEMLYNLYYGSERSSWK